MKYFILLLLYFSVNLTVAQSISSFNRIAATVSEAFGENRLLRQRYRYTVSVAEGQVTVVPGFNDTAGRDKLKAVLTSYVDSLVPNLKYQTNIYIDEYSAKAYATFYQLPEGVVFPNLDNYLPEPRDGFKRLLETICIDLRRHRAKWDTIQHEEWSKEIVWLIDSTGAVKSTSGGGLDRLLDSTKSIRWTTGIYYGYPVKNAVVRIQVDTAFMLAEAEPNKWYHFREWVSVSRMLPDYYQGKWVRFEKDTSMPNGQTVVSFIFNPVTLKMENPVIHRGKASEAWEFIAWLEKREWNARLFYFGDYPYATRSYFCLD